MLEVRGAARPRSAPESCPPAGEAERVTAEREAFDLLVLAAIERAGDLNDGPQKDDHYEHRGPAGSAEVRDIRSHAGGRGGWGYPSTGPTEGAVRAACRRLVDEELAVKYRPKHGNIHFGPSPAGDALLAQLEADGELPELPESPTHRLWREAREVAEGNVPRLQAEIRWAAARAVALSEVGDVDALLVPQDGPNGPWTSKHWNVGSTVGDLVQDLVEALRDLAAPEPE